jgi:hypothetical protein
VKQRSYGHSIVADSSRGVGLEEAIVAASETGGVRLMLRKRSFPQRIRPSDFCAGIELDKLWRW